MALRPSISACILDSCGKLRITDDRGVYHATNNPYGWETPNIAGSAVTEAILTVAWPSGADEEYDVTSQVPDTVTGEFQYNDIEADFPDGIYTITITYSTASASYSKTIKKLFLCNACCCVDKMWAQLPDKFYSLSDEEYNKAVRNVMLAQGLLNSISAAGGCLKTAIVEDVLERIQRLCDFENCNCD